MGFGLSPSARPEVVATLREDLSVARHPADGGGHAWLAEGSDRVVVAGGSGRFVLIYEAGELGIADGGMLFLQVSPFWGWSSPQARIPEAPGYTEVTTEAEDVELAATAVAEQLLAVRVAGRDLERGERVRIVYGAGPAGARVDRYAETQSRFWLSVDGDGDGVRGLIASSPGVDVIAGPPAHLICTLPTTAEPGDTVRLSVGLADRFGNAVAEAAGVVKLRSSGAGLQLPAELELRPDDRGSAAIAASVAKPGVYRVEALGLNGLSCTSNPLTVETGIQRVLWGDLHGHSALSDGTGLPEAYFSYARDVAALDVVALTDHDHWGLEPLALYPSRWEEIRRQTSAFHEPGRFVTLLGFEWTSWLHGHRHVLYFQDQGEVLSSVDPAYETPEQLWNALRGQPVLTFAHHSAGGPVATNWNYPPDAELEPVTEVVSVHGSSEAADFPGSIYSPVPGNFVRDVLDRGYELGFIGSGDSHDGHPGLAQLASPGGGLAAILSRELTREGVLAALRRRRSYATNGPRIYLDVRLGVQPMGAKVRAADLRSEGGAELRLRVVSPEPINALEIVRSGTVSQLEPGGRRELRVRRTVDGLRRGEYLYVRVLTEGGGAAWSSPFFVE